MRAAAESNGSASTVASTYWSRSARVARSAGSLVVWRPRESSASVTVATVALVGSASSGMVGRSMTTEVSRTPLSCRSLTQAVLAELGIHLGPHGGVVGRRAGGQPPLEL